MQPLGGSSRNHINVKQKLRLCLTLFSQKSAQKLGQPPIGEVHAPCANRSSEPPFAIFLLRSELLRDVTSVEGTCLSDQDLYLGQEALKGNSPTCRIGQETM